MRGRDYQEAVDLVKGRYEGFKGKVIDELSEIAPEIEKEVITAIVELLIYEQSARRNLISAAHNRGVLRFIEANAK